MSEPMKLVRIVVRLEPVDGPPIERVIDGARVLDWCLDDQREVGSEPDPDGVSWRRFHTGVRQMQLWVKWDEGRGQEPTTGTHVAKVDAVRVAAGGYIKGQLAAGEGGIIEHPRPVCEPDPPEQVIPLPAIFVSLPRTYALLDMKTGKCAGAKVVLRFTCVRCSCIRCQPIVVDLGPGETLTDAIRADMRALALRLLREGGCPHTEGA